MLREAAIICAAADRHTPCAGKTTLGRVCQLGQTKPSASTTLSSSCCPSRHHQAARLNSAEYGAWLVCTASSPPTLCRNGHSISVYCRLYRVLHPFLGITVVGPFRLSLCLQAQDAGTSASQAVGQLQQAQQRLVELQEASQADKDHAASLQSQLESFRCPIAFGVSATALLGTTSQPIIGCS